MRTHRQFVGALVMAVMIAAFLGIASPASADQGAPGGPNRGTCGFLQGHSVQGRQRRHHDSCRATQAEEV